MSNVRDDTADTLFDIKKPPKMTQRGVFFAAIFVGAGALVASVLLVAAAGGHSSATVSPVVASGTAVGVPNLATSRRGLRAPGNLQASLVPQGGVQLTWSSLPPVASLLGYRVYRRTGHSSYGLLGEVVPPLGTAPHVYVDNTIALGSSYVYKVTAFDRNHEGPATEPLYVVPVSVAPPPGATATSQTVPSVASFCIQPAAAPTLTALARHLPLHSGGATAQAAPTLTALASLLPKSARATVPPGAATAQALSTLPAVKPLSTLVPIATSTAVTSHR